MQQVLPVGKNREYLPCLDLIRIFAAVSTFIFHTYWNMDASYGYFNGFVSQANCCMSLFFILSGFSIAYAGTSDLTAMQEKKRFYKKRFRSIAPEYVLLLIWSFAVGRNSTYSGMESLAAAPYDVIPLFTTIDFIDYGLHVGTWFIADIAVCYTLYPLLKQVLSGKSRSAYVYVICGLYVLRALPLIFPYVLPGIATSSIYRNPFLRTLEFAMGICLALYFQAGAEAKKKRFTVLFWLTLLLSIFGLNWITWETGFLHQALGLFLVAAIPTYCLLVFSGASYKENWFTSLCSARIVRFLSKISYDFWLATFFTQSCSSTISVITRSNLEKISLLFVVNTCFALSLYGLSRLLVYACEKMSNAVCGKANVLRTATISAGVVLFAVYVMILGNTFCKEFSRQSVKAAYDFENTGINTGKSFFSGFYRDEGAFAWVSASAECTLRRAGDQIELRARTSAEMDHQEITVSCDGIQAAVICVSDQVETYYVNIPEECGGRTVQVSFRASQSFIPAEQNETSVDTRELAFRVYKIAVE